MKHKHAADWKYWITYGIVFTLFFCIIFSAYYENGRCMIRLSDGLDQYFYTLCYYGECLRDFFREVFLHGNVKVPMWDMSIGYGADILTTLSYYGVGDPLNLITVFFDRDHMEICFLLLFYCRLFCAGAFFSKLVKKRSGRLAALTASMIYTFSGYTLYSVIKYWQFAVPLMCFPLVLLGIERILTEKKPFLYIFSIFLSAVSNFYFFYMISIFMVLYAVFRYFTMDTVKGRICVGDVVKTVLRFAGFYVIGVCLSMPVLLPVIKAFLEMGRNSLQYPVPLLYQPIYYVTVVVQMFWGFRESLLGCSFLLMPVLVCILLRKENRKYQIVIAVMALLLGIPFFSCAFNGFSYVSDRWYWFVAFVCAYLTAMQFDHLLHLTKIEKILMTAALVVLQCALYILADRLFFGVLLTAGVMTAVLWFSRFIPNKWAACILTVCCLTSIWYMSRQSYFADGTSASVQNYIARGTAPNLYQRGIVGSFEEYASSMGLDETDGRMEKREGYWFSESNSSLLTGNTGMEFYFSIYSEVVAEFYRDLAVRAVNDFCYSGVDGRYILSNLLGAGYLLSEDPDYTQYGYEPVSEQEGRGVILKNSREPAIGYTYTNCIKEEDWLALSYPQRQYALLQAVVINGDTADTEEGLHYTSARELDQDAQIHPCEVESMGGIQCSGNTWVVEDVDGAVGIGFDGVKAAELYVVFQGLDYEGKTGSCKICIKTEQNDVGGFTYLDDSTSTHTYTGKHDFICNIGYVESEVQRLEISFDSEGVYTFDAITIVSQPLDGVGEYLDALTDEKLEHVSFGVNEMRGDITVTGDKILCLTVPYSSGWTAYANGEKVPVMRVNDMMMGLALHDGQYAVRLCYRTPGLTEGFLLAGLGLAGVILLAVYRLKIRSY